jgi:hypothetical protein
VFQGTLGAEQNAVIGLSAFEWREDWDHPQITDHHNWYQTTLDPHVDPPTYGGVREAEIIQTTTPPSDRLRLRNFRPAGVPGSQIGEFELFHANSSLLGYAAASTPHYDAFPIFLLPTTELQLKVDALSANFSTPVQQCLVAPWEAWQNGAYQHIVIEFNYRDYLLELTAPGQQSDTRKVGPSSGLIAVTVGQDQRINLWQALRDSGVPVDQQPIVISGIRIEQLLLPPCQTTTADQEQMMEIDYLRFVDVPAGTP